MNILKDDVPYVILMLLVASSIAIISVCVCIWVIPGVSALVAGIFICCCALANLTFWCIVDSEYKRCVMQHKMRLAKYIEHNRYGN